MPLSMCVAMSQGYIGYDLQNALKEELLNRGLQQGVATVLTQVVVDADDPAFKTPTKAHRRVYDKGRGRKNGPWWWPPKGLERDRGRRQCQTRNTHQNSRSWW